MNYVHSHGHLPQLIGDKIDFSEHPNEPSPLFWLLIILYNSLNKYFSGMFDGKEHIPKLLPCSHTICLECLTRIVATFARDSQFRCPICRELITVPGGGVKALPPSFLVNQLLDLMARQRREVIPKCATHPNQASIGFMP